MEDWFKNLQFTSTTCFPMAASALNRLADSTQRLPASSPLFLGCLWGWESSPHLDTAGPSGLLWTLSHGRNPGAAHSRWAKLLWDRISPRTCAKELCKWSWQLQSQHGVGLGDHNTVHQKNVVQKCPEYFFISLICILRHSPFLGLHVWNCHTFILLCSADKFWFPNQQGEKSCTILLVSGAPSKNESKSFSMDSTVGLIETSFLVSVAENPNQGLRMNLSHLLFFAMDLFHQKTSTKNRKTSKHLL